MGSLPKCVVFFRSKHSSSSAKLSSTAIDQFCHRFSLKELRKSTNNLDESRIIARGCFSTVYEGCLNGGTRTTDHTFAIKRMETISDQRISNKSDLDNEFKNEIELLCQLRHPNVISLIGFCDEKDKKILVCEYMPNGSLFDQLRREGKFSNIEPLSWKKRLQICIGAAHGLHYLHTGAKRTIFHRDVKPSNILLDQNWIPKLSDFGLSLKGPLSISKPKPLKEVQVAGTIGYMAPECFISNTLTEKCDVFSFGMVLLVVVCAKAPRSIDKKIKSQVVVDKGENEHSKGSSFKNLASQVYNLVQEEKGDEIADSFLMGKIAPECWKMFMDIAERCLLFERNERPIMGEVELELEHALALQEAADHTNPSGEYNLSLFNQCAYSSTR